MIERKIKELAFAMEALSRINGASNFMYEIESLMTKAIAEAKKEYDPSTESQSKSDDDDIPF